MIISRTPFRVSLFGGGTDYPTWYKEHGGAVIGTAINKYCYINIRTLPPFFSHKHRIVYSDIELVDKISEIRHPVVRAILGEIDSDRGFEIHHDGDLPARSGLGSSSAFTVGMLNAMAAFEGRTISANRLAREAIRIEQEVLKENVGAQDQIWAAYGGTNLIEFRQDGTFHVTPIIMTPKRRLEIQSHLLLFFTGFSRFASNIAGKQIENMDRRAQEMRGIREIVDTALEVLQDTGRSITEIGSLLHESWELKRSLADEVSSEVIDDIYRAGRDAGAVGGKLLGAGGGGFMLFFAEPEHHAAIRERLSQLIEVDIEIGAQGSKVVIYEPDGLQHS